MSNENLERKSWWIAIAAIVMQLCLGTVYAWSVFKKPLMTAHGWGETETQVTFMICIGMIGIAAAFGGTLVDKKGPRFVATLGGILFGIGTLLAGLADQTGTSVCSILGFGFIAGLGNGFGYVTPIATLIRWFPDKRGLVTGLAVMGFGAGAFFMGKIAPADGQQHGRGHHLLYLGRHLPDPGDGRRPVLQEPPQGLASRGLHAADDGGFGRPVLHL